MSDQIVVCKGSQVECYDLDGNLTEFNPEIDFYIVLPDDYFFFFQTDIVSRSPLKALEAYFVSNYGEIAHGRVLGYLSWTTPVVGFLFFADKIKGEYILHLLKKGKVVVPFLVAWAGCGDSFAYSCGKIKAVVRNGRLLRYGNIDNLDFDGLEVFSFKDEKQIIERLADLIKKGKVGRSLVEIFPEASFWERNRYLLYHAAVGAVFVFILIIGLFLRYSTLLSSLKDIEQRMSKLYIRALGEVKTNDPFGLLLYKVKSSELGKAGVMRFLWALSKVASDGIEVDYLEYSEKEGFTVRGKVKDYDTLSAYVSKASQSLKDMCDLNIENTITKKGRLFFTLRCVKK